MILVMLWHADREELLDQGVSSQEMNARNHWILYLEYQKEVYDSKIISSLKEAVLRFYFSAIIRLQLLETSFVPGPKNST